MTAAGMRGFQLVGFGGPDKLVMRHDLPVPQAGPGEVRVHVTAAGINNTDLWTRQGAYGDDRDPGAVAGPRREPLAFPRTQGCDVAGHIDAVGPGVPAPRIGQRVVIDPVLYQGADDELGGNEFLGSERDGGFADFLVIPAGNAVPVDGSVTDVELASFPAAYGTAMHMLQRVRAAPGETLLVTGAAGGVGSALVQLGRLRGCRVIALTSRHKQDAVRRLGAASTVCREDLDHVADLARALGEDTIDVVADVVGGTLVPHLLSVLRPMGRYVVAGAIAGPVVELDLRTVYLKHLDVIGSSLFTHDDFAGLVHLIQEKVLQPLVARTYPLEDLRSAQRDFGDKDFVGKLVIDVAAGRPRPCDVCA